MTQQFVSYNDGDGDGYANVNFISLTYATKGMNEFLPNWIILTLLRQAYFNIIFLSVV